MAQLRRNEDGEWVVIYGEDEDRSSVDAILAQARNDPTFLQALEGRGSYRIRGADGGNPEIVAAGEDGQRVWRAGNWGTRGYGTGDGLVTRNGQQYNRIGSYGGDQLAGKQFQGRPFTDYLLEDPEYGTLFRSDALAEAGKYNPRDIGDYLPSIMMAAANFIPGLQGAPSLFTSLGQGLGLTSGALPVGMTGAEIAGIGQGAGSLASDMGLVDFLNNPAGATSGNAALDPAIQSLLDEFPGLQGLSNTAGEGVAAGGAMDMGIGLDPMRDSFLGLPEGTTAAASAAGWPSSVGDPFIDAYTPVGTGGGPTGLPVPGDFGVDTIFDLIKKVGPSVASKLLGGEGGIGNIFDTLLKNPLDLAARTGPGLLALNYANNQSPFDMSKLESLYGEAGSDPFYNPNLLSYDMQTGQGRNKLTSSLTRRGVMGSSFGNFDLGSYDTLRDLGRSSLLGQNLTARTGIANDILRAQQQERALKNQLYGRAFDVLGRGLSPGPTLYSAGG